MLKDATTGMVFGWTYSDMSGCSDARQRRIVQMIDNESEPTEQQLWDYVDRLREHWLQWESEFTDPGGPKDS